jgi:phosphatidate cytidylyltransferase
MSEKAPAAPQSDLGTRFAAGVVMIAVACAAIYIGGTQEPWGAWLFRLFVVAGASVMLLEWGDMHRVSRTWSWTGVALLGIALLAGSEWLYPADQMDVVDDIQVVGADSFGEIWKGFAGIVGLGLLYGLLTRRPAMGWGLVYIGLPSFALIVLEWSDIYLVFWLMLVTWATDIFAYFAGRAIGGPKLAPKISPNKTWAGLIGGMAGAAAIGGLAAWLMDISAELPEFLWLGAPMGLLAQLGDLYESRVKRRLGVKDSGTLLPGHGGVLDRLDGLLPVILATLLVLIASLA